MGARFFQWLSQGDGWQCWVGKPQLEVMGNLLCNDLFGFLLLRDICRCCCVLRIVLRYDWLDFDVERIVSAARLSGVSDCCVED